MSYYPSSNTIMNLKLAKEEVKTIWEHLAKTFTFKQLFKYEMEDINYELSPCLYMCVLDLLCHYSVITACHWFCIFLNIGICCIEVYFLLTTKMVVAQHAFIASFQLLGILASITVVTIREYLLDAEKRSKEFQWSLKSVKPKVKAAIGSRGLYQSLTFEFILVLSCIDFYFILQEIRKTMIMTYVLQFNNIGLTAVMYFVEITDILWMCYFILMVPSLHIYFATEAEIQVYLLAQYVKKMTKTIQIKSLDEGEYNREVAQYMKLTLSRYCEIKQLYLDNRKIVSAAGIKYIIPSSLVTVFIIYAAVEGNLSLMTLSMHFLVFTTVLIFTIISGQRYEDEWRHFYEALCQLPWYTWDMKNQKSYLILLIGSAQIVQLIILQTIVVNYSLCIKVWKILYTGANMIYNIHGK